jgi:hypothetical protein
MGSSFLKHLARSHVPQGMHQQLDVNYQTRYDGNIESVNIQEQNCFGG